VEHEGQTRSASEATDAARERVYEERDRVQQTAAEARAEYALFPVTLSGLTLFIRDVSDAGGNAAVKKSGLTSRLQNLKAGVSINREICLKSSLVVQNGLSDRVSQEHKDALRDKTDQGRKVLLEDYFPEDRRDQFIYRSKKVRVIDRVCRSRL
jgi:hypothetical protein